MSRGTQIEAWYVRDRQKVLGPFDLRQMQAMITRGQLGKFHEVSQDLRTWSRASTWPVFFAPNTGPSNQPVDSHSPKVPISQNAERPQVAESLPGSSSSSPIWHYAQNNARYGPVTTDQLLKLIARGELSRSALVWCAGMPQWRPAVEVPDLGLGSSSHVPSKWKFSITNTRIFLAVLVLFLVLICGLMLFKWELRSKIADMLMPRNGLIVSSSNEAESPSIKSAIALVVCGFAINHPNGFVTEVPESEGSGFLVSQDGYILTNDHVVRDFHAALRATQSTKIQKVPKIWVFLGSRNAKYEAKLQFASEDEDRDIAVLKIEAEGLPHFRLTSADDVVPSGSRVTAFGFPGQSRRVVNDMEKAIRESNEKKMLQSAEGKCSFLVESLYSDSDFVYTLTSGIVSRIVKRGPVVVVQHDAEIKPGNSGGPLVLENGRVVGINTFVKAEAKPVDPTVKDEDLKNLLIAKSINDSVNAGKTLYSIYTPDVKDLLISRVPSLRPLLN